MALASGPGPAASAAAPAIPVPGAAAARTNWRIHELFVTRRTAECMVLIERELAATGRKSEFALFVKGLIRRANGQVEESLECFTAASKLDPDSVPTLKALARSLFLLGRHARALAVYERARRLVTAAARADRRNRLDWEILFSMALCELYLGNGAGAEEHLRTANTIQRNERTFLMLAKVYLARGDVKAATDTLAEGLEFAPESDEMLASLGLLVLTQSASGGASAASGGAPGAASGDASSPETLARAFDLLGKSLSLNPASMEAILALGALMLRGGDADAALSKFRAGAVLEPQCAELWANVGMCFYAKGKLVAAVSCLKRAHALAPLEWRTQLSLGLVYIASEQLASAFVALNAAASLNPDLAAAYALLGVVLARLGDMANANAAYERAQLLVDTVVQDSTLWQVDCAIGLNHAISLRAAGLHADARARLDKYDEQVRAWRAAGREPEAEVSNAHAAFAAVCQSE